MIALRVLLVTIFVVILSYTLIVGASHGYDLLSIFFGDIARFGWPGQFNVDFSSFLVLSALWTAWRNNFSAAGLGLAILAFFFGGVFLSAYLLFLSWRTRGDIAVMLMGDRRVAVPR
jgi:hypothetical protein